MSVAVQAAAPAARRRPDRPAAPARLHVQRRALRRLRRRHARLGAARERRPSGRAQLQVPPPARHLRAPAPRSRTRWSSWAAARAPSPTCARPQVELYDGPRRREPELLALGRGSTSGAERRPRARCSRPASTTRPSCGRRAGGGASTSALIRRAAGLGRAPTRARSRPLRALHAHCDVLVVGAGPAGLMAALAAGRSGARVILADEQPELGGALLSEPPDHPARRLAAPRSRPSSRPARSCACSRAPPPSATTTTTTSAWSSA